MYQLTSTVNRRRFTQYTIMAPVEPSAYLQRLQIPSHQRDSANVREKERRLTKAICYTRLAFLHTLLVNGHSCCPNVTPRTPLCNSIEDSDCRGTAANASFRAISRYCAGKGKGCVSVGLCLTTYYSLSSLPLLEARPKRSSSD